MTTSACLLSKEQIRQWIIDLRSGEFVQTTRSLRDSDGFCCLGVLASRLGTLEAAQDTGNDDHVVAGREVLGGGCEAKLIAMNDTEKKSFPKIADWIEKELLPHAPEKMNKYALVPAGEDFHE